MKWMALLNLLEGVPITYQRIKNHSAEDILWKELAPIFATCLAPIVWIVGGTINCQQTAMIDNMWKFYHFTHVFEEKDIVKYHECGKCFAKLILNN